MTIQYPFIALLAVASFFAAIAAAAYFKNKKRNILAQFASKEILPALSQNVSGVKIFAKSILFSSAISLMMFALARPQWGYKWTEEHQMGVDIIFAVDTSKSMLAEDIKPNRLERAKLAINDVVERLGGDRIGLVAFSGQAFLQCPITLDYGAFRMSLDSLDTNIIQRGGTNIASAIDEADSAFSDSKNQKLLVLISDGEELEQSGVKRAEKASNEKGIKIYTLGVGLQNGEPIPVRNEYGKLEFVRDADGNLVSSKLNEDLLKQVAKATGGIYANLSDGGMDAIYEAGIKKAPKSELSAKMKKIAIERFQIPLALSIILLVLDFILGSRKTFKDRRADLGVIAAVLLCASFASTSDLKAQENQKESAQEKDNAAAQKTEEPKTWRDFFNAGIDAFENKNSEHAKENFYKAIAYSQNDMQIHAKSYYNLGCVGYEDAKKSFEKADASKAIEGAKQTETQTASALDFSGKTLKKGLDTLKNSGEEALKEQNLQNEIKGAISQCEQSKKSIEETEKTLTKTREALKKAQAETLLSQKNFENAVELDPEMQSASKNLSAAKNAAKKIAETNSALKDSSENFDLQTKALEKNIEELKKLLRDDNKDNQQNDQNQDSQNNQQNKDNQNNKQNDKQNNQKQENNQNQDKNNSQENQQNSQDNQQQNRENQSKNQNADQSEKDKSQKNQDSKKNNKSNNAQENQKENGQNSENQNAENKQNEQAVNSDIQKEENSADKKDETPSPAEEKQGKDAKKSAQAEEDKDGTPLDYRSQAGVMTRREAAQVLDSLKDDEKKLPLSGYGTQRNRFEEKKYKDW